MADNSEDSCDIDTLAALLDEDEDEDVKPTKTATAAVSSFKESESDVLKKKLEDMEKQMQLLRDQLSRQNETTSNSSKSAMPIQSLKDVGLDFSNNEPATGKKESKEKLKEKTSNNSHISEGDLESSDEDEEGNRSSNKYSEFGQFVKQRLAHQAPTVDRLKGKNCPEGWKTKPGALTNLSKPSVKPINKAEAASSDNGFMDPFFGIKIVNPLIGSATLQQRMEGRKQIKLSTIKSHMRGGDIKEDWVTMAVVVSKTDPRTSQKGKKYSIWKLCDLKDCTKLVSFFLFGDVFTTHWKMAVGSIVGILNPNFMKENNASDEISFTVDHHQKILHVGSSKDLGWCRANRKDGSKCPSFINKSECEFCIYHVQNEFKKISAKRSEIQSSFSGTGLSTKDRLKQKVLGKQEVFYGGQLFSGKIVAPPASKAKDNKILSSLKMQSEAMRLKEEEEELAKKNVKTQFDERLKNPTAGSRNLLRVLEGTKASPGSPSSPAAMKSITAKDLLQQHKQQLQSMKDSQVKASHIAAATPQLGRGLSDCHQEIDLSEIRLLAKSHPRMQSAKLKALRLVQLKGPLQPSDPNSPSQKPNTPELQAKVRKRVLNASGDVDEATNESGHIDTPRPPKRTKLEMDQLIEAKSSHSHLIDEFEAEQSEQYFSKLERKEQMETKMLDTFEIKTTAVTCSKCNYTALSASEICRKQGHVTKTIKAVKRFFACKDCKQRTMSLDRLPKRPCSCGSTNWEKAAMTRERKGPALPHEELLLRGEERKNLNC